MDKWMDSPWFLRIVALLLALMLYASIVIEGQPQNNQALFGSKDEVETVTDVPLVLYYDQENLVVTGAPETVTVELEGPNSIMKSTKMQRQFTIYADLRDLELGNHKVTLQVENISEKLKVNINPSAINVKIQEKVTEEFPVEVDFVNRNQMKPGYSIGEVKTKPNKVKITGPKEQIKKIALVKAIVDLQDVSESFNQNAMISVYDSAGNRLDVNVQNETVAVSIEILMPKKTVPIGFKVTHDVNDEYSLVGLEPITKEVTISSKEQAILDAISAINEIPIDLSNVKSSTVLEVPVPSIEGIEKIESQTVKVKVNIEKKAQKVMKNIPIVFEGIPLGLKGTFIDPESGEIDITLNGAPSLLSKINALNIRAYINVSATEVGKYTANLQVSTPEYITWSAEQSRIQYELQ